MIMAGIPHQRKEAFDFNGSALPLVASVRFQETQRN